MRPTSPIRLVLFLVPALLAACGDGAPPADPGPRSAHAVHLRLGDDFPRVVGDTQTIAADVRAADGFPVEGAKVSFTVVAGGGRLSAAEATTGPSGTAHTLLTLGMGPGENEVEARVDGVASPARLRAPALPSPTVSLSPDPIRLAPGCELLLSGTVVDHQGGRIDAINLQFDFVGPRDVVSLRYLTGLSGVSRGMRRGVVPERVGTTRVTASYKASADTVAVQVVPREELVPHHLNAGPDTLRLAVGATSLRFPVVEDVGGCAVPGPQPAFSAASSAPGVAEVSPDGIITARSAGQAGVVFVAGALADTIVVKVGG